MTLLTGTLLARGCRTVAAALRAKGLDRATNWSSFHQVLNRAQWSPLALSRQLFLHIVTTFVPARESRDRVIDGTRSWTGAEMGIAILVRACPPRPTCK